MPVWKFELAFRLDATAMIEKKIIFWKGGWLEEEDDFLCAEECSASVLPRGNKKSRFIPPLHSISPIFVPAKLRAIRGTHFHPPLLALIATHSSLELLGPTTRRQGDWGEKLLFGGVEATPLSNPAQKAFVPRYGLGLLDSGCSHVLFCAHFCA